MALFRTFLHNKNAENWLSTSLARGIRILWNASHFFKPTGTLSVGHDLAVDVLKIGLLMRSKRRDAVDGIAREVVQFEEPQNKALFSLLLFWKCPREKGIIYWRASFLFNPSTAQ